MFDKALEEPTIAKNLSTASSSANESSGISSAVSELAGTMVASVINKVSRSRVNLVLTFKIILWL